MKPLLLSVGLVLISIPLAAQTSFTSPKGLDNKEGNTLFFHWAGARVMQVVDNTNLTPRPIFQLSFRQDNSASTKGSKGTMDLVLTMSQTPFQLIDENFAANFRSNTAVVFKGKANIPNWTKAPTKAPAPFTFAIKFTKPWVYKGKTALVWHVDYKNATAGTHTMDRDYTIIHPASTTGTQLGKGCGNYTGYLRLLNTGNYDPVTGMHVEVGATLGPKKALTWLFIDGKDSNLTVPGLCTKLHALPTLVIPVGSTDATGTLTHKYLTFPYVSAIQNASLVTQLFSIDTSQKGLPFALTGGRKATMPASSGTYGHAASYAWASGSGTANAISHLVFFGGAPVTQLK